MEVKNPGKSDQITRDYLDSLLLEMRHLDSKKPDTTLRLYGEVFDTPIMMAALSHLNNIHEHGMAEMAKGAVLLTKADVSVAVTGIAGPDGGTEEKPVGLVYIACNVKGKVTVKKYRFSGNRTKVRESAVSAALVLMRDCILEYFSKVTFGKKD